MKYKQIVILIVIITICVIGGVFLLINSNKKKVNKVDKVKLNALLSKIKEIGMPGEELPLVSLEDFFEGNDDIGSMGCNLMEHPGMDAFYRILKDIRTKDKVRDVLVGIYEIEDDFEDQWPFSENVIIITTASKDQVWDWCKELMIDDIWEEDPSRLKPVPTIKEGENIWTIWWD